MRKNTPYQKELVLEIEMLEEREVMSLKPEPIGPVPSENARLAKIVFSASCTFMKMRDELRTLYQVLIGPRDSKNGTAGLSFKIHPNVNPPLSLVDAQAVSSSLCTDCPFNPTNQHAQSPFIARCDTFNGQDLVTKVTIRTKAARNEIIKNASCQPSLVRRLI